MSDENNILITEQAEKIGRLEGAMHVAHRVITNAPHDTEALEAVGNALRDLTPEFAVERSVS